MKRPVVVFDIGGVLIHVWGTWQAASRAAGVAVKLADEPPAFLEDLPAFVEYQAGQLDEPGYFQALGNQLGVGADDALRAHNGILGREYKGVLAIVEELKSAGVRTGIISNTNAPHWVILRNPAEYPAICAVDMPMASHLAAIAKPDPRIFGHYVQEYGLEGESIVFFDDNARNVAAALEFGWRAHSIDPSRDPAGQIRAWLKEEGVLDAEPSLHSTAAR